MSGLFEHLAATDDSHRVASRRALALARARATKRFANFLANGDKEGRLALVAGDLTELVKQACSEVDYDDWEHVYAAVQTHLGFTVEARKPKMCPVHREITDISLSQGDPQAGFAAMAQHMFSEMSCRGTWEGGRCNFKPEMTTQSYWDTKAEERRLERERQREQENNGDSWDNEGGGQPREVEQVEQVDDLPEPTPDEPIEADAFAEVFETPDPVDRELVHARFAAAHVPSPIIHGGSLNPLRMIEQNKPGLVINGLPFGQFEAEHQNHLGRAAMVEHPHPEFEQVAAEVLQEGSPAPMYRMRDRKRAEKANRPMASTHEGEALKTVDVDQGPGPSPKMDKRKWTPENVQYLEEMEMDGTPHPTREQDIAQPAQYEEGVFEDDGRFEQTEAVTEKQDIDKDTQPDPIRTNNWPGGGDRSAVAATDPDKNPITEFVTEDELERAMAEFGREDERS